MREAKGRRRIVIMGAAGRDFHVFNTVFRSDAAAEVVAFTAAQIPNIAGRRYPAALAGQLYPDGVPIEDEGDLERLIRECEAHEVVFAYSDVTHEHVMHMASRAMAAGADFRLCGPRATMLASSKPVIAITAVRTGCGKSPVSRWLARYLRGKGRRVAVLRHPMPYGDLTRQRVQRFATMADIAAANCTNEEREEYEPHVAAGNVVFAGVDYAAILASAETEADVVVWDGGNNDFPFVRPDLHVALVDALRPDQVASHHPGETVARMADAILVSKADAAPAAGVRRASEAARAVNPRAVILQGGSPATLADPDVVRRRRVLVVEDGPTITHGGMAHGAGYAAAVAAGVTEIVDPRAAAVPEIQAVFRAYPHIGPVLPAVGYDPAQLDALRRTIDAAAADVVVSATPLDLGRLVRLNKPVVRVSYEFVERGEPRLSALIDEFLARRPAA